MSITIEKLARHEEGRTDDPEEKGAVSVGSEHWWHLAPVEWLVQQISMSKLETRGREKKGRGRVSLRAESGSGLPLRSAGSIAVGQSPCSTPGPFSISKHLSATETTSNSWVAEGG